MSKRSHAIRLDYRRAVLVGLVAMTLGMTVAATANAAPVWSFKKVALVGEEVMVGAAINATITIPSAPIECKYFLFNMKIFNFEGGKGTITELPMFECATSDRSCSVTSIEAEKLPWAAHVAEFVGHDYLVIEGVKIGIVYGGALCPFAGERLVVKGSAGGLIEEKPQTVTFNNASYKATGTALKLGTAAVELTGVFAVEMFEFHREQPFEI
jgi:hypothetical protein